MKRKWMPPTTSLSNNLAESFESNRPTLGRRFGDCQGARASACAFGSSIGIEVLSDGFLFESAVDHFESTMAH